MDIVILIPGIMGTTLLATGADGKPEEVWPPTPYEAVMGYKRLELLTRPDLKVGEPINKVACYNFYSLLREHLDDLGFKNTDKGKRRIEFGYDWRQDNFDSAQKLAELLQKLHIQEPTARVTLVGHSMGGLVSRLLLEQAHNQKQPWFANITQLITLGTPHLGAPLALARIFGLDSTAGVSAKDVKRLANDPRYPSAYQLLPAPGEAAVWALNSPDLRAVDIYEQQSAKDLGLDYGLVNKAQRMHQVLAAGARPEGVRYFYFAGSGHQTVTRINVNHTAGQAVEHAASVITKTNDAGDGTVPLYSSLPTTGQRQIVINEHATVFKGETFRRAFFRLLGGNVGTVIDAGVNEAILEGSLDRPVYEQGEPIEVTLEVLNLRALDGKGRTDSIEGELVITDARADAKSPAKTYRVNYSGPLLDRLSLVIESDELAPGLYELRFQGQPTLSEPLHFAITKG
ncbi:alpha/beta fold hydrolase [Pantoea sp. Ap-967]|uniref:lipase/acyltransferase domain-containing protein n=1 Tax=Pantoea sp. Ap-967 TaxID=2608362 RepID=UPI0014218078|nr:alpha/beta fold hydrolase [Pantoea sp. Ap-967]